MFGDTRCLLLLPAVQYNQLHPSYHFQMIICNQLMYLLCMLIVELLKNRLRPCQFTSICGFVSTHIQLNRSKNDSLKCQSTYSPGGIHFVFQPITFQPLSDGRDASGHIGVSDSLLNFNLESILYKAGYTKEILE